MPTGCLISIVIPVYNRPRAAMRAARSALMQQLAAGDDIEVLLVDDGSTPPLTLDAEGRALERVRVVRLEPNSGPAAARNRGIAASSGDFIAFLDSDDVWEPGKLARQLALFRQLEAEQHRSGQDRTGQDRALLAIGCGFYYPNHLTGRLESRLPIAGRDALQFASGCWTAPGSVLLVHRSAFERIGLLDARLRRLEDYDWLLRFGLAGGRLEIVDHIGAVIAPSGLARSGIVSQTIAQLAEKYAAGGLPTDVRRRFEAYLALERAAAEFADSRHVHGCFNLMRSLALKPRTTTALLPFWTRGQAIPAAVAERYRELLGPVG